LARLEPMAYLRIVLVVLTMIAAIALWGLTRRSWMYSSGDIAMMFVVMAGLCLNLVYLLGVAPTQQIGLFGRFPRMFRLWLDAKEQDLRQRAIRSADSKNTSKSA
jgi:hypothetical protein